MSSHHKSRIALEGGHENGEHGIKVHTRTEVGEFFSRFEYVVALEVAALTNVYLQFPRQAFGVYNRPICVFSGVNYDAIRFFFYV